MVNKDELIDFDFSKIKKELRDFNLNTTDILIIMSSYHRDLSITDLQRELDMAYKNIYPHLKKLEKFKVIKIKDNGMGKKKTIIVNDNNERAKCLIYGISGFLGIDNIIVEEIKKRKID